MEETLYELILDKLDEIKEIKFSDLDFGQLMVEVPPISYPAVLVSIDYPDTKNMSRLLQEVRASIKLTIATKSITETNSLAPKEIRSQGLEFLRLRQKIYKQLQGFGNEEFYPFERKSMRNEMLRQGLKTTVIHFETSFHDDSSNS